MFDWNFSGLERWGDSPMLSAGRLVCPKETFSTEWPPRNRRNWLRFIPVLTVGSPGEQEHANTRLRALTSALGSHGSHRDLRQLGRLAVTPSCGGACRFAVLPREVGGAS